MCDIRLREKMNRQQYSGKLKYERNKLIIRTENGTETAFLSCDVSHIKNDREKKELTIKTKTSDNLFLEELVFKYEAEDENNLADVVEKFAMDIAQYQLEFMKKILDKR